MEVFNYNVLFSLSSTGSSVLHHNLSNGCLHPAMSCGMVQTDNYFASRYKIRLFSFWFMENSTADDFYRLMKT